MRKFYLSLLGALLMTVTMFYSVFLFKRVADNFVEITVAGAEQTRDLLADERNEIVSISEEGRATWVENLKDPRVEATGLLVIRDLGASAMYMLFAGYIFMLLHQAFVAFKSYNKRVNRDQRSAGPLP